MIIQKSVQPRWDSDAHLVASEPGSEAIMLDPGSPLDGLLESAFELELDVSLAQFPAAKLNGRDDIWPVLWCRE